MHTTLDSVTVPADRPRRLHSLSTGPSHPDDRPLIARTLHPVITGVRSVPRSLLLVGLGLLDLLLLGLLLVVLCLIPIGVGLVLAPAALDLVQAQAQRHRAVAEKEGAVVGRYRDVAPRRGPLGITSLSQRLDDPLVQRDLAWTVLHATVGLCLALLPIWLVWWGIQGVMYAAAGVMIRWDLLNLWNGTIYQGLSSAVNLQSYFPHLVAAAVFTALGVWSAPRVVRLHQRGVRMVLGTSSAATTGQLLERVGALTRTRRQALDLQETEIERIERDLHDGAQARLVALGMDLNQVSRLVHEDPDRAVQLLDRAKTQSAGALTELRQLVRGIRPPVLADRGLVEAVRALAATVPVPTRVRSDLDHRLAAPLETALYFAVAELVTNAVKHADAERITVEISSGGPTLPGQVSVTVMDDGRGGAQLPGPDGIGAGADGPRQRSGLEGVQRRLAAFDGELHLNSPVGGPTVAWVFIPDISDRR